MDDDDIRHLLQATYGSEPLDPSVSRGLLAGARRAPRHRRMLGSLIAVVAAVIIAVPVGVGVLLRTGTIGGSSSPTRSVLDLHMFSATTGWGWAGGNEILHTTSGVDHWTIVPPPIGRMSVIEVAWIDSETARVLATADKPIGDVERTYTLRGWLTNDGGATWTQGQPFTTLLETAENPSGSSTGATDLDFVDPMHGWFFDTQDGTVGGPILIFRTVDGGMHWSKVEMTPAKGTAAPGALPGSCSKYGMTFLNPTTGWVAGGCDNGPFFYVTHDGGATWHPQPIDCGGIGCYLDPPQFTSKLDGQMDGQVGVAILLVTHDGGKTWQKRVNPPSTFLDFINAEHGFTLGLTGNSNPSVVLWKTNDNGRTWAQAHNGAIHGNGPHETAQLDFLTPGLGWAVSFDIRLGGPLLQGGRTPYPTLPPELWQTTDGGTTWSQVMPIFTSAP